MFDKTKPMTLGDIFSSTFDLIKVTFTRNLIVGAVILIPVGIIMAFGIQYFFSTFFDLIKNKEEFSYGDFNAEYILNIMASMTTYFLSILLFALGTNAAKIGITRIGYRAMENEKITINQAFNRIFSVVFFRTIGMSLLQGLAYAVVIFVAVIIMVIAVATDFILLKIFGVFSILAAILVIVYLNTSWHFTFVAIAGADKKVFESFSKSSLLVTNNWWRVFGIVLLVSIIVQFAISLISTPVSFALMWDFLSKYFTAAANGTLNNLDPESMFNMMKSLGLSIGLITVFSSLVELLIIPLFDVVFYFDLRIRKNDFYNTPAIENPAQNEGPALEQQ